MKKTKTKTNRVKMPQVYSGETYFNLADLWRDHFIKRLPYTKFHESIMKHPNLSLNEAADTHRVRKKTLDRLASFHALFKTDKSEYVLTSYLEGDCLGDDYGIDLNFKIAGQPFNAIINFDTKKMHVTKTDRPIYCDSILDIDDDKKDECLDLAYQAIQLECMKIPCSKLY